jgi:hypothetical protein
LEEKIVFSYEDNEYPFDEKTFARKIVKIYRTMRKMEQNKHLEPKFSISFSHISDVLLQNYKESSSMTSSIIGGHSQISSSLMKQSQTGY